MIEGKAFSTGFDDSCSSSLSKSESSNGHLWYIKKSIVISDSANNNGDFISIRLNMSLQFHSTYCPFKSWATFEIEIGGLLTLEEISLLNTVLLNIESGILLERNLKSYSKKNAIKSERMLTYFDEKMNVEIGASSVLLVGVSNSSSFDEINTLITKLRLENASLSVNSLLTSLNTYHFLVCIFILNNSPKYFMAYQ